MTQPLYVIGDIHGEIAMLDTALDRIAADGGADAPMISLGDLVDRGPDSAGVIALSRAWSTMRRVSVLMGNHEEMFLGSFDMLEKLRVFLRFGGKDTLMSYGLPAELLDSGDLDAIQMAMLQAVPQADREWMEGFGKLLRFGDYIFVHAGLAPGTPLDLQLGSNCRWIREPFLSHSGEFPGIVVHGHTITDEADIRHNRIGIDTGAYQSGRPTAIGLDGSRRWLIEAAREDDGPVQTHIVDLARDDVAAA